MKKDNIFLELVIAILVMAVAYIVLCLFILFFNPKPEWMTKTEKCHCSNHTAHVIMVYNEITKGGE